MMKISAAVVIWILRQTWLWNKRADVSWVANNSTWKSLGYNTLHLQTWKIVWLLISYLWDFWLKAARVEKFLKFLLGLCVFLGCSSSHIFLVWNFYRQKMTIFAHFFQSVTCPKKCREGSPCVGFHFLGFYTHFISKIRFGILRWISFHIRKIRVSYLSIKLIFAFILSFSCFMHPD